MKGRIRHGGGGQTWRILAWRGVRHKGGKDIKVRRGHGGGTDMVGTNIEGLTWREHRHEGGQAFKWSIMEGGQTSGFLFTGVGVTAHGSKKYSPHW